MTPISGSGNRNDEKPVINIKKGKGRIFPVHPDMTKNEYNRPRLSKELKNKAKNTEDINIPLVKKDTPSVKLPKTDRSEPIKFAFTKSPTRVPSKPKAKPKPPKLTGKTLLTAVILFMVILLAGVIAFRKNALAVIVNDEPIGYIKASGTTEQEMNALIVAKLKDTVGNDVELNESITLKPVSSLFKNVAKNPETIVSQVCETVTYRQKATSIDVQKQSFVIVSNLETAKEAVKQALAAYKLPEGHSEPQFAIQIGTSDVFVDNTEVSTLEEAVAKLSQTQQVTKEHTVVSGDTFAQIARNAGMTEQELYAANPSITTEGAARLSIGQKIKLVTTEPILPVRSFKVETKTEEIPYDTERTYTDEEYYTYEEVTREGVNGQKEVYTKTPFINGEQKGDVVKSEKIVKEPVNRQILEGTAGYDDDEDDEDYSYDEDEE